MAAPRPRPTAPRGLALLGLLALVACASSMPEPVQHSVAQQPAPAAEAPAPVTPIAEGDAQLAELEASLAAYEQQLTSNEARLQAMGVRLAQRPLAEAERAEAKKDGRVPPDNRFAPPPPAMDSVGDASAATRAAPPAPGKAKSTSPARKNAPADPRAPAPTTKQSAPSGSGYGRAAGGVMGPAAASAAEERDNDEGNRCGELCELAGSTCELEAKICDLAARHPREPRYAAVCQRAGEDCRIAADACNRCSP